MEKQPYSPDIKIHYPILTPENTVEILKDIGRRREEKGGSEVLFPKIDNLRHQAENLGDKTTVLTLLQEKFLCAQHMIMESKKNNPLRFTQGLLILKHVTKEITSYQKENEASIDPIVNARTFRFLGRFEDQFPGFRHNQKSEKLYQKSLDFFDSLDLVEQRFHRLELSGFLAFSQLKQNNPEWFNLTINTLSDFDKSVEGVWFKGFVNGN